MDSHVGTGVVTFDTGEAIYVLYSLNVRISGGLIEVTGNIKESDQNIVQWFGKAAVITLKDGTRLPIFFNRDSPQFTATSGPL